MIIPITVLNESFCRAAKDEDVYDAMFNLLSNKDNEKIL